MYKNSTPWDKLSMAERSDVMNLAIKQGITNLDDIRATYNSFGDGGDKKSKSSYIHDVLPELLRKAGLNIRVTSGYRPAGAVGTAGSKSWHPRHGAVDIVPQGNTTFEDIERVVTTNPEIVRYMTSNGFGFLDETNRTAAGRALMKKTGATGNHFHFGKDTSARNRYQKLLGNTQVTTQPSVNTVLGPSTAAIETQSPQTYTLPTPTPVQMYTPNPLPTPDLEAIEDFYKTTAEKRARREALTSMLTPQQPVAYTPQVQVPQSFLAHPMLQAGNAFGDGGSIHIKPSHRGRLTELKKRTGKSEAELYNDGNPAHKKMVVFARNARKWHKHADGGNLYPGGGIVSLLPAIPTIAFAKTAANQAKPLVRKNLYENLTPVGYSDIPTVAKAAIGIPDYFAYAGQRTRDDFWAEYLEIPKEKRRKLKGKITISPSMYRPTKGKPNPRTFRIDNLSDENKEVLIDAAKGLNIGENRQFEHSNQGSPFEGLGRFTVGKGHDSKGTYISYYDEWNLSPFSNKEVGGGGAEDESFGIGSPFDVYDRIYLDDYLGIPAENRGSYFLPEVEVRPWSNALGGPLVDAANQDEDTSVWQKLKNAVKTDNYYKYRGRPGERTQENKIIPKRIRENNSPTKAKSTQYEDVIRDVIVEHQEKSGGSNPAFDIPYLPEKSILINGSLTSTNALDSLAKYAGVYNRNPQLSEKPIKRKDKYAAPRKINLDEMLGLAFQETHGGAISHANSAKSSNPRALANSNFFTAYGFIPADDFVNDYHYNDAGVDRSVPPLLDAFQYFAQGDYNRNDKSHTRDVNNAGKRVWKNPKVKEWWETSGRYWYETGQGPK